VDAVSTPNLETIARCLTSYAYFCAELVGLEGRSHGSVCDDCADCCDRELISYLGVFFGSGFACLFAVMGTMSFFWSASLPLVEASTLSHLGEHTYRYERIRLWDSVGFVFAVVALGLTCVRLRIFLGPCWVLWWESRYWQDEYTANFTRLGIRDCNTIAAVVNEQFLADLEGLPHG
jgi:hypothetical protein